MSAPEGHQGPTAVGTIPSNLKGQWAGGLARQGESSEKEGGVNLSSWN